MGKAIHEARSMLCGSGVCALLCAAALALAAGTAAAVPYASIDSPGPLTHVAIGSDLSCQVRVPADGEVGEFYPPSSDPGDCGTFLSVDGQLYAPDFDAHDRSATGALEEPTPFTPVSQSPVTGAGTASSPFTVTTSVTTDAGVSVYQADSYLLGNASYETLVIVTNNGADTVDMTLSRAADCYVARDDYGYGAQDPADGRVLCLHDMSPNARYIAWVPHTPGSESNESDFSDQWSLIAGGVGFFGDCLCDGSEEAYVDNGAGLSWSDTIPVGESRTYSSQIVFGGDLSAPSVEAPPPPPPPSTPSPAFAPSRSCEPVRGGIGTRLLASLRCTATQTVLEAKCAIGIVSLVGAPLRALKAAQQLKNARGLYDLRRVKRKLRPLARLLNDVHRARFVRGAPRGWRTEDQVYRKLTRLDTGIELMRALPSLAKAVTREDFNRIVSDLADVADLEACVQGVVNAVST